MTRVSLRDEVTVQRAGYMVARDSNGWTLRDPEGDYLLIASYGMVAPTKAEAVLEAIERIGGDSL